MFKIPGNVPTPPVMRRQDFSRGGGVYFASILNTTTIWSRFLPTGQTVDRISPRPQRVLAKDRKGRDRGFGRLHAFEDLQRAPIFNDSVKMMSKHAQL